MRTIAIKPVGKLLKQAGLISDIQITEILNIQSQSKKFKFGKILVQQGILKQKTVDFFIEQFPQILRQKSIKPLGYYFQESDLITSPQIKILLEEQKSTGMLLGELALEKKWLKPKTLNFFLHHLKIKEKNIEFKLDYLSPCQQEIINPFHLATKAAAPYALIQEIFYWTGKHPFLTQQVCQIVSNYDKNYFIPAGMEVFWVGLIMQNHVISDWKNQDLREYLTTIESHVLNNKNCSPKELLQTYWNILHYQKINLSHASEKQELKNLGLVTEINNNLKVSNRIFQEIFDCDWVKQQLSSIANISNPTDNQSISFIIHIPKNKTGNKVGNQIQLNLILLGIVPLLVLLLAFFSYYSQKQKPKKQFDTASSKDYDIKSLSNSSFCTSPIPSTETERETWRIHLEREKAKLQDNFPKNCQNNLNKISVKLDFSNHEFYENYQQSLMFLKQSDSPKALEHLYHAAEKAITTDKANLLLTEILKHETTKFQTLSQKYQDWQFLKEALTQADPNDYQLMYQRAKLKLLTDDNKHHTREFESLFAAAKKAIENQQAKIMLAQLKQDEQDRFGNLAIDHPEWINLIKALEQNNKKLLD